MVEVKQNLGFCILLSAIGGVLEVFATAALAYPDAKKKQEEEKLEVDATYNTETTAVTTTLKQDGGDDGNGNEGDIDKDHGQQRDPRRSWGNPWLLKVCLGVNVLLQLMASVVGNLLAPWYGPVSIVGPTFLSSQLLANMVIYGSVLGIESFTKDMRIGTCVIVTAAILLPVVGPDVQDHQNAYELMTRWYSFGWNAILIFGMLISGAVLLIRTLSKKLCQLPSMPARYIILLMARSTSFAINLSYSKIFALDPQSRWLLLLSIILKVISGMIMTGSIVVQSTTVSQNTFVPLNATLLILLNAATGIIVWEDWKVVASWLGYCTVFVQLIVGNYLLLGEIDLFGPQNQRYGRRLVLKRIAGNGSSTNGCLRSSLFDDEVEEHVIDDSALTSHICSTTLTNIPSRKQVPHLHGTNSDCDDYNVGRRIASPTLTVETSTDDEIDQEALPSPTRHVSVDVASAWLSSSIVRDGDDSPVMEMTNNQQIVDASIGSPFTSQQALGWPSVQANSRQQESSTTHSSDMPSSSSSRPPSLARRRHAHDPSPSSPAPPQPSPSSPTNISFADSHRRPASVLQRSSTTGGSTCDLRPTTISKTLVSNNPLRPIPLSSKETQRSQTTGLVENLEELSQRRSHYFGSSANSCRLRRKVAWGQIYGVNPEWLQRRWSMRQMETIRETVPTTASILIEQDLGTATRVAAGAVCTPPRRTTASSQSECSLLPVSSNTRDDNELV